jgi:thiamine-monophosphate kinase
MDRVGSMGEFALIDRLLARLGPGREDTLVGAGHDDAAVLAVGGRLQLATIDSLVEGVHFVLAEEDAKALGRRLAAVNLSDIAAMGGRPTHALAGMVAGPDLEVSFALDLVEGLAEKLACFDADLVGGNVARGARLVLDLALLGEVDESALLLRSGARPGDLILVTGALGGAAAARAYEAAERTGTLAGDRDPGKAQLAAVRQRLHQPEPRLSVAPLLRPGGATAAIDISDGLAADAGHVSDQSGVGLRIEAARLPVDGAATAVAAVLDADPLDWALSGGEDYELLVTADPRRADELSTRVSEATGVPLTPVGVVTSDRRRTLVLDHGKERPLAGGWRHFG